MPTEYTNLVTALKALTQGESPNLVKLPMAEDDWNTRPETVSYGIVSLDFEADALRGDNIKVATAYEGSVDLYSLNRDGAGWVDLITATLTEYNGITTATVRFTSMVYAVVVAESPPSF